MKYNNAVQIDSPGRRAAAYWFVDGLPEIVFGLFFLFPGMLILAYGEFHWQKSWWLGSSVIAMSVLGYLIWFLHRRVLDFLKARITYPRTGYAHPPHDFPDKNHPHYKILTLGTAHPADENVSSFVSHTIPLICAGNLFVQLLKLFETRWGLPLVMTGIAAGIYFLNRNGARSYSWRAVLPIALAGFVAPALGLEPMNRAIVPMVICGAWLLGIGTWTLVHYLRAHPKSDAGREGRP
jgi:uncharacterized membrane protein HdeD (DUF308 family)